MTSSKKHRTHGNYNITLNTGTEIIKPQDHEVLLGGTISSDLKWKEHIRDSKISMVIQITKRLNALKKVSRISNFKTRKMIANGIILSKLSYLIQLWGGTSKFLLTLLQKLQNQAARLVTKGDWYTPVETLLRQCGWLSIKQLVIYHDLVLVFKIRSEGKPEYFYEKFTNEFGHCTRLKSSSLIKLEGKIPSALGEQNFTYNAVLQWNSLPPNLRQFSNLKKFKIALRSWIKTKVPVT